MDEELGLRELELGDDVFLDCWRRCGCECDDGRRAECGQEVAEGAVVGAKVVTPGGDAVSLVDGDERGLFLREHLGEVGDAHAFWRDEEELEGAVEIVAAGLAGFVAGETGMNTGDAKTSGGELACLVVHKCDERRDDEGGTSAGDGGELIAERFSCSGGHDQQDVAAVGGGSADGLLIGTKRSKAEGLVKQGGEIHQLAQFRIIFVPERSGTRGEAMVSLIPLIWLKTARLVLSGQ